MTAFVNPLSDLAGKKASSLKERKEEEEERKNKWKSQPSISAFDTIHESTPAVASACVLQLLWQPALSLAEREMCYNANLKTTMCKYGLNVLAFSVHWKDSTPIPFLMNAELDVALHVQTEDRWLVLLHLWVLHLWGLYVTNLELTLNVIWNDRILRFIVATSNGTFS